MDGGGRRPGPWWLPLIRWTLLTGVLAGLFGMHVLTAETAAGGHGPLPHTMSASSPVAHNPAGDNPAGNDPAADDHGMDARIVPHTGARVVVAALPAAAFTVRTAHTVAADSLPSDGHGAGHAGLGGCVLSLVVGGALALLALLASRAPDNADGAAPSFGTEIGLLRRRGPPGRYRPRVALCVIRV